MNDLFSGITTELFANPADVTLLKCGRANDIGDVWFHGHGRIKNSTKNPSLGYRNNFNQCKF